MSQPAEPSIVVVGAGPAGLMAAQACVNAGAQVAVFDAMPSVGRKFLLAGRGGLNLTHSEPAEAFGSRYGGRRSQLQPMIDSFGPAALRAWAHGLGVDTFVGTSGRVFPREMKAAPMLRAWLRRLREAGVVFHSRCRWDGSLAAGDRAERCDRAFRPHQFLRDHARELGFCRTVDHYRIAALVLDVDRATVAVHMMGDQFGDALLQPVTHLGAEGAHAETERSALRDDVGGNAGIERADGDDGGLGRIDVARHDALQRHDQAAGDQDRIDRKVGACGMAAAALDADEDAVGGGHEGAAAEHECADRIARVVVQAEDRIAREAVEQSIRDHPLRTAVLARLLGRLEHEVDGAGEAAGLREPARRAE